MSVTQAIVAKGTTEAGNHVPGAILAVHGPDKHTPDRAVSMWFN
jgi:hypothetical protein